ncbi:MAG: RHS repeat-associated core domain-containing protein [Acidobacteria bacterium]|nr:RHS repeat-associated core domain-containing protein [Acidobacteriota bacterium]
MNDYAFDSFGNTTKDANGRTFVYDAENKQIEVKNASNETIGQYWFDGDGRRVTKRGWINGQWEETIFVYDASSRLVAEYSTILNPTPQVAYLTADHLGSPRINTNELGTVISRHDYRPYGEEITERTHAEYIGDTIRKQFTGYERDDEIGLDYAQARYYNSGHGRFTSTDPYLPSALVEIPQSWNRYSYVLNKPFVYVDPSGEDWEATGDENNPYKWIDKCAEGQENCFKVVSAQVNNSLRVYGSKDEKDITNYNANKSGMIDMREVAKHHDAQFVVKSGANRPFLNGTTGSALFNVAFQYHELHPTDQKLMMTGFNRSRWQRWPTH